MNGEIITYDGPTYEDTIFLHTATRLGWKDRLLLILGRELHMRVEISCEKAPGKTWAHNSTCAADRFIFPWTRRGAAEVAEPREGEHDVR